MRDQEQAYESFLASMPAAKFKPEDCRHLSFSAFVAVNRLEDTARFSADVRIVCAECYEPFRFMGMPPGLLMDGPACSIDGIEAHLPIEPEIERRLFSGATFQMPTVVPKH